MNFKRTLTNKVDDGNAACYNGEEAVEGYKLCIGVRGFDITGCEDCFWMSAESYWDAVCNG